MNLWAYLDRRDARRLARPQRIDFLGWVGIGLFVQSTALFGLMAAFPNLLDNQGFMTLASAVIVTGWIGGAAAYAYSAGKATGEQSALASKAVDLAGAVQAAATPGAADGTLKDGDQITMTKAD